MPKRGGRKTRGALSGEYLDLNKSEKAAWRWRGDDRFQVYRHVWLTRQDPAVVEPMVYEFRYYPILMSLDLTSFLVATTAAVSALTGARDVIAGSAFDPDSAVFAVAPPLYSGLRDVPPEQLRSERFPRIIVDSVRGHFEEGLDLYFNKPDHGGIRELHKQLSGDMDKAVMDTMRHSWGSYEIARMEGGLPDEFRAESSAADAALSVEAREAGISALKVERQQARERLAQRLKGFRVHRTPSDMTVPLAYALCTYGPGFIGEIQSYVMHRSCVELDGQVPFVPHWWLKPATGKSAYLGSRSNLRFAIYEALNFFESKVGVPAAKVNAAQAARYIYAQKNERTLPSENTRQSLRVRLEALGMPTYEQVRDELVADYFTTDEQ